MKDRFKAGTRVRVKDTPELRRIPKMPCGRYGTVLSYHHSEFGIPVEWYKVKIDGGAKHILPPADIIPVQPRPQKPKTRNKKEH